MTSNQSTPNAAALVAEGHAQLRAGRACEVEQSYRRVLALGSGFVTKSRKGVPDLDAIEAAARKGRK